MNKRAKGNRIEREFMQVLKNSKKFIEIWKPCHCRGNSDIFGLFDIMAITDINTVEFFQIKSNKSDYSRAKKRVQKFQKKYGFTCYVVLRVKKGLWKICKFYISFEGPSTKYEYYINEKFEMVEL